MNIKEFEKQVLEQSPFAAGYYDDDYFFSEWRSYNKTYTIEHRRTVEGKNPALIKAVLDPKKVLDFGCGPGTLLYLLWELGIDCEGIDFSLAARNGAPAEVRNRIWIGDIAEQVKCLSMYDLVICREVLEHLTMRQIQRAVEQMAALSSRFIYVTTRFAANTSSPFAFEIKDDQDPSHITLINKDLLRCMFVLQGFHSRYDLEQAMDWRNLGRVLVLEKSS